MAETSTSEEKAKKLCYERRAACIIKKSKELQILCGVKVGVVILGPDGRLESWPPQLGEVKALLDACKERPGGVRCEKRNNNNPRGCREILDSKLQLLNQRVEFFKGNNEIASTSEARSEKRKEDFGEEILKSKLELLNKKAMAFCNRAEGTEDDVLIQNFGSFLDDDDLGGEFPTMDDFLLADLPDNCNVATDVIKGNEIATNMDSGILQPNHEWHHGSNSTVNHTQQPGCSVRFDNNACYQPPTAAQESGELQPRKKAKLQNDLPATAPPPAEFWRSMLMDAGFLNSTDAL